MIVFDASNLVVYLHPNPKPAKDRNNKPVSQFRERVNHLVASLNVPGKIIGIPTPALAEVLVHAGAARATYIYTLNDTYRFQMLPFGFRAAIEASELIEKIQKEHKEAPKNTWAKVKFDMQIIAIAKAESATVIYSDDKDIESCAKRVNIPVVRICDLDIPPPPDTTPAKENISGQFLFKEFTGPTEQPSQPDQQKSETKK